MTTIANSLGVGSGIDTQALIDALVAAERKPRDDALTVRSDRVTARISGRGQVVSALDALVAAMASRTRNGALGPQPASSDASVLTARATAGATRSLRSTAIEVRSLAAGQSLVSGAVAAGPVGAGTLTITLGIRTNDGQGGFAFAGSAAGVDVTVGASDDLAAVAAAINKAGTGIAASIVADGQGGRLVLKGPTGAASAFIVAASGDPGLDRFVHRPGVSAMTVAATAADAALVVDGVAVGRATNSVTDLLPGVTLDLVKAAPGTTVTVAAQRDTASLTQTVTDLVDTLNALHGIVAPLMAAGGTGTTAGALVGDAPLRAAMRALGGLTGGSGGGLAGFGVSTKRDGTLSVDADKLAAAVARDPDAAETLLSGLTASGGALTRARAALGDATDARLTREQAAVTAARTDLDTRMTTLREQLTKQYAAMETAVAGFKATQSYLDQQIKAWNRSDD